MAMDAAQPLDVDAISTHFTARGRWHQRLPTIRETLEALSRIRKSPNNLGVPFVTARQIADALWRRCLKASFRA